MYLKSFFKNVTGRFLLLNRHAVSIRILVILFLPMFLSFDFPGSFPALTLKTAHAEDIDVQIKNKEKELAQAKYRADMARAEIRKDHHGDSRPVDTIIQSDIAFETHFGQKLADAKNKLLWFPPFLNSCPKSWIELRYMVG